MARPKASETKTESPLNKQHITAAALSLLDEVGYEGLTMRALAQKLDIKAASLYWHVQDKQELLGLLAEEICAPMQEPDRALPWQTRLEQMAHAYRRVLLAHRDAARVFANGGAPTGPNQLRLSEIVLATLLDAGFPPKDAAYAGLLVNDYVTMFVREEQRQQSSSAQGSESADEGGGGMDEGIEQWRLSKHCRPGQFPGFTQHGRTVSVWDRGFTNRIGGEIRSAVISYVPISKTEQGHRFVPLLCFGFLISSNIKSLEIDDLI